MSGLKVGDSFPEGVKFSYIEPSGDDINTCGIPGPFDASAGMLPAASSMSSTSRVNC